jgi:hypothetical protein
VHSDVDVLIVRPDTVAAEDPVWTAQLDSFSVDVAKWCGNRCAVIDYSASEFANLTGGGERLIADLHRDGILLAGTDLVRRTRTKAR